MSQKHLFTSYPLLVIVGSTGSGKSDLAVRLARKFNGELVSADSRQVYKSMNIATNKLKPPRGIEQWMVNVVRPDEAYNLKQYQRAAMSAIKDVHKRGKLPILVGGTAMYVDAVADNWTLPQVKKNRCLRAKLEQDLAHDGLRSLVRRLRKIDPISARMVDAKNSRRVIRALEVVLASGASFIPLEIIPRRSAAWVTTWNHSSGDRNTPREFLTGFIGHRKKGSRIFNVFKIGLRVDRDVLRERLRRRAALMVRQGLIAETKKLLKKYDTNLPSMSGIGYAEAAAYIEGRLTRNEMIERIVIRSMQYARRQMTWWKRDDSILWQSDGITATQLVSRWLLF